MLAGPDAATEAAALPTDVVLNGMTGSIGLRPTLAALAAGSTLALANKESLVAGGPLVKAAAGPARSCRSTPSTPPSRSACAAAAPTRCAAWCSPRAAGRSAAARRDSLHDVTPEQALAHPTWAMGPVVTINSATMVNKSLEVIEAHLLFDIPYDRIDVVVHPQSMVHSMVEFVDGSTLAQVSPPDMRLPIALGLSWPDRVADAAPGCDWTTASTWTFEPLDEVAFPAVALARRAGAAGGTAPAVYNAANEECVAAFLAGRLPFLGIVDTLSVVVEEHLATAYREPSHRRGRPSRRELGARACPRADGGRGMTVALFGAGLADLPRRDRLLHRPARDRPPAARQGVRRQGHPVHGRLRPHDLVAPQGRDGVRRQGDARSAATSG